MHLTVTNMERVQCLILLFAFDGCGQGASTLFDIVVCIYSCGQEASTVCDIVVCI